MKIIHRIGNKEYSGEGEGKFLLTNKKGSYLALGKPESDHDGWFTYDAATENLVKTLDSISIQGEPDTITNGLSWVERKTKSATERFFLTSNALIYEISDYTGPVTVTLDCKRLYDESTEKRIYSSENKSAREENALHVHYTKYSGLTPQYTRHVLITTDADIKKKHLWRPKETPYDARRGLPGERWVYTACEVEVIGSARIILTTSADFEKAKKKTEYVLENEEEILHANEAYPRRFSPSDIERSVVIASIDSLITKLKDSRKGIFAGLPWFFQFWMRDEALALGAIIKQKHYSLAKEILQRQASAIREGSAHEKSTLRSADGPGLLAKRCKELLQQLTEEKQLDHFFTKEELDSLYNSFSEYADSLPYVHGLVQNQGKETWMDTAPDGDERSGSRIEIQCLTMELFSLLQLLGKILKRRNDYERREKELQATTKEWFYDRKGRLLDGFHDDGSPDTRTRPNVFLAWYFHPDLLSKEEWEKSFDTALEESWLDWGGLSSMAKSDPSFHERYTGMRGPSKDGRTDQNNWSYHHGDSWFFINNIAAMALFSINPHKYSDTIEKLLTASRNDLFFQGFIGHSSELSDAKEQKAGGCLSQAWSITTLYELLELLHNS